MAPGRLLSGAALEHALDRGLIFAPGTWVRAAIRGPVYDVRLASDLMIVPGPNPSEPLIYGRGDHRTTDVMLAPGDTAFLSSIERAQLDWRSLGVISAKFRLASRGLLTLNGQVVDPGYGLERISDTEWAPMDDQRLYFVVANVGADPILLRPGDAIARLQVFEVVPIPPEDREPVGSPGYAVFQSEFFTQGRQGSAGLVFFRNVRVIGERAELVLRTAEELHADASRLLSRVETLESGSKFVVTFGIYLVTVTILGVCIAVVSASVSALPDAPSVATTVVLGVGGAVLLLASLIAIVTGVRRLWER